MQASALDEMKRLVGYHPTPHISSVGGGAGSVGHSGPGSFKSHLAPNVPVGPVVGARSIPFTRFSRVGVSEFVGQGARVPDIPGPANQIPRVRQPELSLNVMGLSGTNLSGTVSATFGVPGIRLPGIVSSLRGSDRLNGIPDSMMGISKSQKIEPPRT